MRSFGAGSLEAIEQLDTFEVSDLTALLAEVRPNAIFPTTHRGIQ